MDNRISIRFDYAKLKNNQYAGEFGEQLVKLNFIVNSIDTFIPVIDDSAVDFVAKINNEYYFDVQVKTIRLTKSRYFYETKKKWGQEIRSNLLIAFVILQTNKPPLLLLIPGENWKDESLKNNIFSDRDYDGKKSDAEWGLTLSSQNLEYLEKNYEINKTLDGLKTRSIQGKIEAVNKRELAISYSTEIKSNLTLGRLKSIFEEKPGQWGLRGDPFLWEEFSRSLDSTEFPRCASDFYRYLCDSFLKHTGTKLLRGEEIHVEKFNSGGMSSGLVFTDFWIDKGIPLLLDRFEAI